jgi:hypothetical protein
MRSAQLVSQTLFESSDLFHSPQNRAVNRSLIKLPMRASEAPLPVDGSILGFLVRDHRSQVSLCLVVSLFSLEAPAEGY